LCHSTFYSAFVQVSLSSVLSLLPFWVSFLQVLHITKPFKYVGISTYSYYHLFSNLICTLFTVLKGKKIRRGLDSCAD
jgi:hypothetical protein